LGVEVWELGYRVEDDLHLPREDIEDHLVPFEQGPRPLQEPAIKQEEGCVRLRPAGGAEGWQGGAWANATLGAMYAPG